MPIRRIALVAVAFAIVAGIVAVGAIGDATHAQIKRDEMIPKRHFKIERPANLSAAEALAIYGNISETMARGYAASRELAAQKFHGWRQYNSTPYRSPTHGNRYVNNYANAMASRYGRLKPGEKMPPGALLAKDSFTVSANGDVYGGPLFIMEKLGKGVSPQTDDWRYVMIMPDGSYFGDSTGDGAERVGFCNGCHRAATDSDYLFFIPAKFRKHFLGGGG